MVRLAAADPVSVQVSGTLTFTTSELEQALALRAQLATSTSTRRVVAAVHGADSRVAIELEGRSRTITLDGERGPDAARLVAFAILDLAGDRLDPPQGRPRTRAASVEAARDSDPRVAGPRDGAPMPGPGQLAWAVGIWGAVGTRSAASIDVRMKLHGRVHAIAAAGASLPVATSTVSDASQVTTTRFPVRLGLGVRVGALQAQATASALVERATGERTATAWSAGGGGAIMYAPVTIGGFSLLGGVGVDVFLHTIDYRLHGTSVTSSERVAWWAGIGVAREVSR